jgi:hypothetical protein
MSGKKGYENIRRGIGIIFGKIKKERMTEEEKAIYKQEFDAEMKSLSEQRIRAKAKRDAQRKAQKRFKD